MSLQGSTPLVTPLAGGRDTAVADQGAFYVGITPTPGTGIIMGASVQAFTETTPFLVVYNAGLLNIYPAFLRLHTTVAGATDSNACNWTNTLDTGNRLSAIGSGTALTVSNTNMASANKSSSICSAGPITATAATSARRVVGHAQSKLAKVGVVHDCILFNWGGPSQQDRTALIDNTTTISHCCVNFAPIVIGPNQSMVLVAWGSGQTTGTTFEVEFGFMEK